MKMDLKHFKKLHSNEKSTTFIHKNGHKIIVAHDGVDEGMRKQLSELPKFESGGTVGLHADYSQDQKRVQVQESYTGKSSEMAPKERKQLEKSVSQKLGNRAVDLRLPTGMADGGGVEQSMGDAWRNFTGTSPNPDPNAPPEVAPNLQGAANVFQNFKSNVAQPSFEQAPNSEQPQEQLQNVQIPQAAPVPAMPQTGLANMEKYAGNLEHGLNQQATAEGMAGQREAQTAQAQQNETVNLQKHYQEQSQALDNERMQAYNDYKAGHIEPNHYVQNMTGFQKGMTAIGLILSGMGAGMTGGPSQAMEFLNKQIDRDIEAQKAELGKKDNLLSHLQQQFGNLKDSTIMAKSMQADLYSAKMQEIAAQSKDPMAKARAEQAIAQLHIGLEPQMQEMKMRQAVMAGMKSGDTNLERAIPILVPKEHQQKAFEAVGKLKDLQQNQAAMVKLFRQAAEENTVMRTGAGMVRTPASVTNLQNMFLPIVKDLEGRINEYEFESVKKFIPAPGDTDAKIEAKFKGMNEFINQKTNEHSTILRAYGLPVSQGPKGFTPRK